MLKELLQEKGILKIEIENSNFKNCKFYKIKTFSYNDVKYNLVLVITENKTKFITLFKDNICINNEKINQFEKIFFMEQMDKYLKSSEFQELIPLLSDVTKTEILQNDTEKLVNLILTNGN